LELAGEGLQRLSGTQAPRWQYFVDDNSSAFHAGAGGWAVKDFDTGVRAANSPQQQRSHPSLTLRFSVTELWLSDAAHVRACPNGSISCKTRRQSKSVRPLVSRTTGSEARTKQAVRTLPAPRLTSACRRLVITRYRCGGRAPQGVYDRRGRRYSFHSLKMK
jgi:hypothetical protein